MSNMMNALAQMQGPPPSAGSPAGPMQPPMPSGGAPGPSPGGNPADLIVLKMQELNALLEDLITSGMPLPADQMAPELQSLSQNLALITARDGQDQAAPPAPGGMEPPMPQMPPA